MKAPEKTQIEIIADVKAAHRQRRYAIKIQQKIDRAMESFVRINATEWSPSASEDDREKNNRLVKAIIAAARKGEGLPAVISIVTNTDVGRKMFDTMRDESESEMEKLAKGLAVAPWVGSIRGAGMLGLATIVAEAGDISNYPNVAKLWSRLGFAPYDGAAGSTWKREKWRARTLTKDEWIEHPFSGQRYALMHQIVIWLVNAQWIGAAKTDTGEGKPNGHYGEVYAARRAHTMETHSDWTKQHRRMDALRVTMKSFLADLWVQWHSPPTIAREEPAPVKRTRNKKAA
jgi:hypothetical protein